MEKSRGRPETTVGLIDGPLAIDHPDLADANIRTNSRRIAGYVLTKPAKAKLDEEQALRFTQ
jgi:hypothetical protein